MKTFNEALLEKFGSQESVDKAVRRKAEVGKWYRARKAQHRKYRLQGGPYHGHTLELSGPSTGVFTLADGTCGQYVLEGPLSHRYAQPLTWKEYP